MLLNSSAVLRQKLASGDLVWGPGVYDGISARIAEDVGFPIIYVTGAGSSASRAGEPDLGLITATELVENARMVQSHASVPVVSDADHGFGSVVNVIRTVHQYEQAGVAGIHIEDQAYPKRCGHLAGKVVVDAADFGRKIAAAAGERWDSDFVIIARTDARAVNGFDDAWKRMEIAFDNGADVGFFEAPESMEEVEEVARRAAGRPMLLNMATNGKTPSLTVQEIQDLGFRMAIWPAASMIPAAKAIRRSLETLKNTGTDRDEFTESPKAFFDWVGLAQTLDEAGRYEES